jgi:hypothetical protein
MDNRMKTHADTYDLVVGKQIQSIDNTAANMTMIMFTDGSSLRLDTEHVGYGIYGIDPLFIPKPE